MGSLKRWTQVGSGEFHKWTEPGDALEGIWRGTHDGQYGPLGTLDTGKTGRVTFPLHTALFSRMEGIKEGAEIRIIYKGKATSKGGREFKSFDVFVASLDDIAEPAAKPDDDDEVPF